MTLTCPRCTSSTIKKNGYIHNGKQNHQCLNCGRQFVLNPKQKIINEEKRSLIWQAFLERVSLEGVCRIFNVRMPWLLQFINEIIEELPKDLNATVTSAEELEVAVVELDEQWSCVEKKNISNGYGWFSILRHGKFWRCMWASEQEKLGRGLKKKAIFYTDKFSVYCEVIPWMQHRPVGKESGKTSYIEKFNNTLIQRCSRLVRKPFRFRRN